MARSPARKLKPPASELIKLGVYDGTTCLGFILESGRSRKALDLKGRTIGIFGTRKQAADAVAEAAGRG